jgi:4-alpha-glucanotransferase
MVKESFPALEFIAEDLGFMTPEVMALRSCPAGRA